MLRGGEQLKVSEVAGLIDQIQTGGGSSDGFKFIKNVTANGEKLTSSGSFMYIWMDKNEKVTLKFTPKQDIHVYVSSQSRIQPTPSLEGIGQMAVAKQDTEYTLESTYDFSCVFMEPGDEPTLKVKPYQNIDFFSYITI